MIFANDNLIPFGQGMADKQKIVLHGEGDQEVGHDFGLRLIDTAHQQHILFIRSLTPNQGT